MNRRTASCVILAGLAIALAVQLVLIDYADLRVEISVEPELVPYNYAEIELGRQEDAARLERNRAEHFIDGKWQVEASFDHEAHWRRQMQLLEQSNPLSQHGGANGRADLVPRVCPDIRANNAVDVVDLNVAPREVHPPGAPARSEGRVK